MSRGFPGRAGADSSWPVIGLKPPPAPRLWSVSVRTPCCVHRIDVDRWQIDRDIGRGIVR